MLSKRLITLKFRHLRVHKILGCWRWKALWQYKNEILPVIFDTNKKGIDFGGANGPVSLHTTIVDFAEKDSFQRPVKVKNLKELTDKLDYIFSSHTLEHIEPLEQVLKAMTEVLKPKGRIIFHVPAYTCVRWQSGIHTNKAFNDHAWSFHLKGDQPQKV